MQKVRTESIEVTDVICDICGKIQPEIKLQNSYLKFYQGIDNQGLFDLCPECLRAAILIGYKQLKKESK